MTHMDFIDISYLKNGNQRQKKVYDLLIKIDIMDILKKYNPILVGTIPIEIDTQESDIDIICEVYDFKKLESELKNNYGSFTNFKIVYETTNILMCYFFIDGFDIEIYASNEKTTNMNGYRHMMVEAKLLNLYGNDFRNKVLELKKKGFKTEPAIAKLLNLDGDPYLALLKLENYNLEKLGSLYRRN